MVFVVKQEPRNDDEGVAEAAVPVSNGAESDGVRDVAARSDSDSSSGGNCDKCGSSSSRSTPDRDRVQCGTCNKMLANRTTLIKHLRIHTGEKPYQCSKCNRCFRQKEHRDKHVNVHSQGKAFECVVCSMTFGRRHFLEKHMDSVHKMDMRSAFEQHAVIFLDGSGQVPPPLLEIETVVEPPLPPKPPAPKPAQVHRCPVCRRTFSLRYNMRRHMRTQHGQTSNTCHQCGKDFKRMSGLRTHEITHSDFRPYQCALCGRCFSQKHHLMRHRLVHAPKINIVCSVCQRGFRYASTFFEHMAMHDAEEEMRKNSRELQVPQIAEIAGVTNEEHAEDFTASASSFLEQESAEEQVFVVGSQSTAHQEELAALLELGLSFEERQVALQEEQVPPQEQQWHREDYVAIDNLDLDCMFCGSSMLDPCSLYQHLLEHCRETCGGDRDDCWEIGGADEILGL
ncbi:hypothetical protein HPB50_012505 [Hyalomma asiaticum]|uniref:Uncharacterized protein n=1 Tax=Hyalomma asiaticum TaxID=266040 RepID=A0ACB7SH96_HYAAI|nr:hypothetical protein HPB50_012505 [Hyalomma asiaticum]